MWGTILLIGTPAALLIWLSIKAAHHTRRVWTDRQAAIEAIPVNQCEECGAPDCAKYLLFEYKFIGLLPIAYVMEVSPYVVVLCPEHVQRRSLALCRSIGRKGYWGFPGVVVAPWFVYRNLAALGTKRILSARQVVLSLYYGVVLGWIRIVALLIAVIVVLAVGFRLSE
jgi:hypothetical protein